MFSKGFPFYYQLDRMDCGPVCLKMVAKYYGKDYSLDFLRKISYLSREGVTLANLSEGAKTLGFATLMVRLTFQRLIELCPWPCILHWHHDHFIVLTGKKKGGKKYWIADPGHGIIRISEEVLLKNWTNGDDNKGVALLLAPKNEFFAKNVNDKKRRANWKFIFQYIKPYKDHVLQLGLGIFFGNVISLLFPFLTQILVDEGVMSKDMNIVVLILIAQIALFIGEVSIELIRGWLLLHMNTRISISIVADFLLKIMKLPIKFFDTKSTGDITQRIQDHERIEQFLTGTSLNALFSLSNVVILSFVVYVYSPEIFIFFFFLSLMSIGWILIFLKQRRFLDYSRFQHLKESPDVVYELINGMQDIKLNNCESVKKEQWEKVQVNLFKVNTKSLLLEQHQRMGFKFINHLKNIIISYIAAREAVNGNITIGMLLGISYIIGQASSPLDQLISFFRSAQDTKISLERLEEIHKLENEQEESKDSHIGENKKIQGAIILKSVYFRYGGPRSPLVLKGINMIIPEGKVTAIVGTSGSGKSTLLKLILKFYNPTCGKIMVDERDVKTINTEEWRKKCGIVMQNGYIFSDTIANNIAINRKEGLKTKCLDRAASIANISDFIQSSPLGYSTKLGNEGNGISAGQQQRILIARAVCKDPSYIFFDESTSALDANNERIIIEHLNEFFKGKTVVVIAHRLSTVKHADQIVVLNEGVITESGTHTELIRLRGDYFHLVKNQLELGS